MTILLLQEKPMPNIDHSAINAVMQAITSASVTLNPNKCTFGATDIELWGLRIGSAGVRPDPAKVEVLKHITPPRSKEDMISILCMMQSNADFIPNFAQQAAKLRELTKKNSRFTWTKEHHAAYEALIKRFTSNILLVFFDMRKQTFIFTDASHIAGLGALLAQGDTPESARPIAIASTTTSIAEQRYLQLDLEALGIDFVYDGFVTASLVLLPKSR